MKHHSFIKTPRALFHGLFLVAAISRFASATTITNLSSDTVSVAAYSYQPFSSNSGGLAVITPEGFHFGGWYNIGPGETLEQSAGWKYVERNGDAVTWGSLENSNGVVRNGSRFAEFLSKQSYNQDKAKLIAKGFKSVDYQKFTDGHFNITGDRAYEIVTQTFNFDDESRSIKFIANQFKVGGHIVDYDISANNHRASVEWKVDRKAGTLSYNGSIEGKQPTPFGARDKAYYSGSVKVRYTRRN